MQFKLGWTRDKVSMFETGDIKSLALNNLQSVENSGKLFVFFFLIALNRVFGLICCKKQVGLYFGNRAFDRVEA